MEINDQDSDQNNELSYLSLFIYLEHVYYIKKFYALILNFFTCNINIFLWIAHDMKQNFCKESTWNLNINTKKIST